MIINDEIPSAPSADALADLNSFRRGLYSCLTRHGDALFELTDAVACATGPVTDLARLSLEPEHHRGHGSLYDGLNTGVIDTRRLRRHLATAPVAKITGPDGRGRIVLAVDVSNWLRPDAATSQERSLCHTSPRGAGQAQMIPGWAYSFVAALESGVSSWTALLDVTRIRPDDDATDVTATQLRTVIDNLRHGGHHQAGDADVLVVMDASYDVARLAWLLDDLPVTLIGRLRSETGVPRPGRHASRPDERASTAPRGETHPARCGHPPAIGGGHLHRHRPLRARRGGRVYTHAPKAQHP